MSVNQAPATVPEPRWPALTVSEWEDTRDTLQLWTQVIGKVRLALEPMLNHWWQVPLYVSRARADHLPHAHPWGRARGGVRLC